MNYEQQSNQGCLPVCLMYLFDLEPTRQMEEKILNDGLFELRENYMLGCVLAFLKQYPEKRCVIYVDNRYYLQTLKTYTSNVRITFVHNKNNAELLDSLKAPYIVYVDNHITDGYTHLPHFMLIVGSTKKMFDVFDPWKGKTMRLSKKKILSGVDLLRRHVRVCPFVIAEDYACDIEGEMNV